MGPEQVLVEGAACQLVRHVRVSLTSPLMPGMDPICPVAALPGVKKLTTEAGAGVPGQPRAEETPAFPPLVQTALQLLPPPRLFFLRLAPRLASVGLIFTPFLSERSETAGRVGSESSPVGNAGCNHWFVMPGWRLPKRQTASPIKV